MTVQQRAPLTGGTLNTGAGLDTVAVATAAGGPLPFTINGQGGNNLLSVSDTGTNGQSYLLTGQKIGWATDPFTYQNFAHVTLNTGSGASIQVGAVPTTSVLINGSGSVASLFGPQPGQSVAKSPDANAGTLDSQIAFTNIANLFGGSVSDDFVFQNAATLSGSLIAGAGPASLDLSKYAGTGQVSVNLTQALGATQFLATANLVNNGMSTPLFADFIPGTFSGGSGGLVSVTGNSGSTLSAAISTAFTQMLTIAGFTYLPTFHVTGDFSGELDASAEGTVANPIGTISVGGNVTQERPHQGRLSKHLHGRRRHGRHPQGLRR